jgi:tripartite-type tricarboxylate transporter receptor subunit TctC
VIDRIAALAGQALDAPDVKTQLAAQGMEPLQGGPAEYERFFKSEVEKWARVINAAGIKAE